jgi:hypothetical protein
MGMLLEVRPDGFYSERLPRAFNEPSGAVHRLADELPQAAHESSQGRGVLRCTVLVSKVPPYSTARYLPFLL